MKLMNIKTKDWLRKNWLLFAWFYPNKFVINVKSLRIIISQMSAFQGDDHKYVIN
jgi:hypothetical protein